MSLRLEPLQNVLEAVEARLTHPVQRVGSLHLAEVGRSIAARGVEDVCFAVHVLDHEVLPLERKSLALAFVNPAEQICQHLSGRVNLKMVFTCENDFLAGIFSYVSLLPPLSVGKQQT